MNSSIFKTAVSTRTTLCFFKLIYAVHFGMKFFIWSNLPFLKNLQAKYALRASFCPYFHRVSSSQTTKSLKITTPQSIRSPIFFKCVKHHVHYSCQASRQGKSKIGIFFTYAREFIPFSGILLWFALIIQTTTICATLRKRYITCD